MAAPLTKKTSTLVLPDKLPGDTGVAPWLRVMPTDPERRAILEDKIRTVYMNLYNLYIFCLLFYILVLINYHRSGIRLM